MKILALANSKGGVGKTSVAVHLAAGFALGRERTLLVDLDPGGHATTWLLGDKAPAGIAEALVGGAFAGEQIVELPTRPNLWLAPSSGALDTVEAALGRQFGKETILAGVLKEVRHLFDVVVIDCPPTTGFLTQSAVYAAQWVLAPVLSGYLGLAGVVDVNTLIKQVRTRGRSGARLLGYVVFAADHREGITDQTRDLLRGLDDGRDQLFTAEVRLSTAAKRLPAQRATAWDAGADERGREDYRALLRETRSKLETTPGGRPRAS